MKTSSLSALTAAAVSAILLGATLSAAAQTPPAGLQNIQRLRPPGPATIDCVNLHDSHCNTRITGSASPICVVQVGATTLNLGPGGTPVSTTVTAACTPNATEYAWQATAGQSPSGKSSSISFAAAGNYCFTVAGRNQAIYRDYGAPSPQLCITVNDAAPAGCAPQASYTSYLSCPAGQSGQIARYFTYDTQTCSWSYSDMNGCVAQPICDPSQYQEQTQVCPAGQSGTIISRSYLQCPGNTYGPWMIYSSSCVPISIPNPLPQFKCQDESLAANAASCPKCPDGNQPKPWGLCPIFNGVMLLETYSSFFMEGNTLSIPPAPHPGFWTSSTPSSVTWTQGVRNGVTYYYISDRTFPRARGLPMDVAYFIGGYYDSCASLAECVESPF